MRRRILALSAAAVFAAAGAASAHPLRLDYCVQALGGGMYQYAFTLTLDNHDGSWAAGQGWRWFIFGDRQQGSSPLRNWVIDPSSLPVGPWTQMGSSGGYHNGPTFSDVLTYWVPNAVGETLTWRGTSTAFLDNGQVLFSTLAGTLGGALAPDFDTATRVPSCTGPSGGCCRPDGSCILIDSTSCTNEGGVYRGNGSTCTAPCPQPATGACCLDSGCVVLTQAICTSYNGTYRGNNVPCGTAANCAPATAHREFADAGDLPSTAKGVNGGTGPLSVIHGSLSNYIDADMYKIRICDPANFSATMTGLNPPLMELFLFDASGVGISNRLGFNGPTAITNMFTSTLNPGEYYLAAAAFLKMPQDSSSQYLWITNHFDNVERRPDGPGASNPIDHWDTGGGIDGIYDITLTGACFLGGAPCYANCDGSTTTPVLTVNDFVCFQSAFAAGSSYANCDHSTIPPVLTVNDFVCFQAAFAAGCP